MIDDTVLSAAVGIVFIGGMAPALTIVAKAASGVNYSRARSCRFTGFQGIEDRWIGRTRLAGAHPVVCLNFHLGGKTLVS